jgi:TolB protein
VGDPSSSTFQLVALDLVTGKKRALTEPNPYQIDRFPRWSPDGARIAFVRNESLQLLNFASGEVRSLVSGGQIQDAPAWSPDGRRIAFVEFGETGTEDIHVTRVGSGRSELMVPDRGYEYGPAWSPDGRFLVFGRDGDLFRYDIERGSGRRLTRGDGDDGAPAFSPSGRRIAFQRDTRILILDLQGGRSPRRLDVGRRRLSWPAWINEG